MTVHLQRRRRRWRGPLQVFGLIVFTLGFVEICNVFQSNEQKQLFNKRQLLQTSPYYDLETIALNTTFEPTNSSEEAKIKAPDPLFPPDLFTPEQRAKGAILLHVLGMVYMFVALAIVCDEFFVPSLDVIIEKAQISEDVAGATFMAAGGSAPELFTSVIGVFISFDDVGIGTIVGSAVFNILFVIGMCVLFSKTVLDLTWWPLFRDVSFYSVSLLTLVIFFQDNKIYWWEALILFVIYILYCSFMKFNEKIERFVKRHISKTKVTRVCSTDQLVPNHGGGPAPRTRRPSCTMGLHSGTKFRHGLLQLMIHTIDPLHDGKVDEKATQLHAIASLKVLLDATKPQNGRVEAYRSDGLAPDLVPESHLSGRSSQATEVTQVDSIGSDVATTEPHLNGDILAETASNNVSYVGGAAPPQPRRIPPIHMRRSMTQHDDAVLAALPSLPSLIENEDEDSKPIDLRWPDTWRKRLTYIFVAPLVIPMWLTLPDTRTPRGKKFFMIAFFGSILWIAFFSYLMVWWASMVGNTIGIPNEVMGLTILAAGTSVPDLITSVIVARKGFGDMAVSSSVGSNIFDVCCGLPIPWLLYALQQLIKNLIYAAPNPWNVQPIYVNSEGMACSILMLFVMLMFVIISIACSRWKMSKGLGLFMFVLYFIFVVISLSLEYGYLHCFM